MPTTKVSFAALRLIIAPGVVRFSIHPHASLNNLVSWRYLTAGSRPTYRWMRHEEEMRQLQEEQRMEEMKKAHEAETSRTSEHRPALLIAGEHDENTPPGKADDHDSEVERSQIGGDQAGKETIHTSGEDQ